jgi:hypothetical protein
MSFFEMVITFMLHNLLIFSLKCNLLAVSTLCNSVIGNRLLPSIPFHAKAWQKYCGEESFINLGSNTFAPSVVFCFFGQAKK